MNLYIEGVQIRVKEAPCSKKNGGMIMAILFINCSPIDSLSKEPYSTLAKKYKRIEDRVDGEIIEIFLSDNKNSGFSKGFYSDEVFVHDPAVQFIFSTIESREGIPKNSTFVRMSFSFDCNEDNYRFYQPKIQALKKRADYFYVPMVSHLGYEAYLSERFTMNFDVVVPDKSNVLDVCFCLLNLIIAILAFEN